MFNFFKIFIFIFCIVATDCSIASNKAPHLTQDEIDILRRKNFRTPQEKQVLFKALGVKYIKHVLPHESMKPSLYNKYFCSMSNLNLHNTCINNHFSKKIVEGYIVPISIQWINQRIGFGAFAQTDLQEGEFVGEYTGKIKSMSSWTDAKYIWGLGMMRTQDKDELSVDALHHGNELRFFNDNADESNCEAKQVLGRDGIIHVVY